MGCISVNISVVLICFAYMHASWFYAGFSRYHSLTQKVVELEQFVGNLNPQNYGFSALSMPLYFELDWDL